MKKFTVDIDQTVLEDLKDRLKRTRWPADLDNEDWSYGTNREYLQSLTDYWLNEYDWLAQQKKLNSFDHFIATVDDYPIHFIREKATGPAPIPLILTHGWPWTFWDYHKIIRPLADPASFGGDPADAFEVIVPSLPGFGFSTPVPRSGMNYWRTADLWDLFMRQTLGFERYAAQGGDWGAVITSQMSHAHPQHLIGIHVTNAVGPGLFSQERPWDMLGSRIRALPEEKQAAAIELERRVASHVAVAILDPQTISYAMQDSPVGLLAWIIERRKAWSDPAEDFESEETKNHMLTTAMIFWASGCFVSSSRFYADTDRYPWRPSHERQPAFEAPAGISLFLNDRASLRGPERIANYNVVQLKEHEKGGHFAPYENPEAVLEDIRSTFRQLR